MTALARSMPCLPKISTQHQFECSHTPKRTSPKKLSNALSTVQVIRGFVRSLAEESGAVRLEVLTEVAAEVAALGDNAV